MTAIEALDLPRILEAVAEHARCDTSAAMVREATIVTDAAALVALQRAVDALQAVYSGGERGDWPPFVDCREALDAVAAGSVAPPEHLVAIRGLLLAGAIAGAVLDDPAVAHAATLTEVRRDLAVPTALARRLQASIGPDGTLDEAAFPELSRLRSDVAHLRGRVTAIARQAIERAPKMFRSDQPALRDGRTVVTLAANFRGRVDGIVHGSSGSGETLFVEPAAVVAANNDLARAEHAVHAEIARVLRELTAAIRTEWDALDALNSAMIALDAIATRARYGVATVGRSIASGDRVVLRDLRHPLLGTTCVPIAIELRSYHRLVVVSGPNTGGKTVLLKSIGVAAYLRQIGVPLCAHAESRLPLFDRVLVSLGDQQSLVTGLSSFSAELATIARVLERVGPRSLVLLDELAAGTDPEEGGAIALSLLDHLLATGCTTVVTTHLGALKHYGFTHDAAVNVAMDFDVATGRPNYRVRAGVPGTSRAIAAAGAAGLPQALIDRAVHYAAGGDGSVASIVTRLQEQLRSAERAEALAREAAERAEREAERIERERVRLEHERAQLAGATAREYRLARTELRSRVEAAVRAMHEAGAVAEAEHQARAALAEMQQAVERHEREGRAVERAEERGALAPGAVVEHRRNAKRGVVRSVRGSQAEVQFDGGVKMRVAVTELRPVERSAPAERRLHVQAETAHVPLQLDLRGRRVAAALELLDTHVDGALRSGLSRTEIVHGTGTGALQQAVRTALSQHPSVRAYCYAKPEEGGFGKTVVELG